MNFMFVKFSVLKQKAKELKLLTGKSYCQCLHIVVCSYGFNSMAHYYSVYPKE